MPSFDTLLVDNDDDDGIAMSVRAVEAPVEQCWRVVILPIEDMKWRISPKN